MTAACRKSSKTATHPTIKQRSQVRHGMWLVLLPGAVGCIVFGFFFQVRNAYFQGILLTGVAGFLAMVLFVIIALDRPFVVDMGITAEPYQLIYDHHMKPRPDVR